MRGMEGLRKMWNGWQNVPAWEFLRSDCSVSKITFHHFPNPVLLQITLCTKYKGGGSDGTSERAQPKPLWLLVLCWGCGKGAEVLLFFHFKGLEDLHYLHWGFFCWKQLLLYFNLYFKCFGRFLLAEEAPASQVWMAVSPLDFMTGVVRA